MVQPIGASPAAASSLSPSGGVVDPSPPALAPVAPSSAPAAPSAPGAVAPGALSVAPGAPVAPYVLEKKIKIQKMKSYAGLF